MMCVTVEISKVMMNDKMICNAKIKFRDAEAVSSSLTTPTRRKLLNPLRVQQFSVLQSKNEAEGIRIMNLKDVNHQPTMEEIEAYISNDVFNQFFTFMNEEYKALYKIEYSKDVYFKGWNVKLRKAGKSLCVIYPKVGYFTVLIVVGVKEQGKFDNLYPTLSEELKKIYNTTKEGNNQRWMMIDIHTKDEIYDDVLKLIKIRRESK